MKKYIIGLLIIVFLIAGCFYLVFSRDENLTITYIKFKVNPEFVIGINNQDRIVMYNPLNEEAKIFNLTMFNDKNLIDMCKIFVTKLEETDYLEDNNVNLTIMTKNLEKKERIYKLIQEAVWDIDSKITVKTLEPTDEELLAFSNEVIFDLEPTYQNDDLIKISNDIKTDIEVYVEDKIKNLKMDKLSKHQKKEMIESNFAMGYFDDFDINSIVNEYNIIISNRSNYRIEFYFNDDLTYTYNVILDLEFDYYQDVIVDEVHQGIVEVYKFTYNSLELNIISNYKNHFYKFYY